MDMFLEEKIADINHRLEILNGVSDIVIWGAGIHTIKMFEKTNLLSYDIKDIVDIDFRKKGGAYFGFSIKHPEEICWSEINTVVISVFNRDKQIKKDLIENMKFTGNIITLYTDYESTPFYCLPSENSEAIKYLGDYDNWDKAYNDCNGYEDDNILDTVSNSIEKVLKGEAVWERDGVLFYEPKYVYQICAAILRCAVQNDNQGVRILDLGGSLGSTYFQNRKYIDDVKNLEYVVAEQDKFADYGHENLENEKLHFVRSADNWEEARNFDIILISGSLQYINPYEEIISKIVKARPRYIIIDRIMISNRMRICRQIVPEKIYKSSYPVRLFSEDEIMNLFISCYELVEKDISSVHEKTYFIDGEAEAMYYVFRRID